MHECERNLRDSKYNHRENIIFVKIYNNITAISLFLTYALYILHTQKSNNNTIMYTYYILNRIQSVNTKEFQWFGNNIVVLMFFGEILSGNFDP